MAGFFQSVCVVTRAKHRCDLQWLKETLQIYHLWPLWWSRVELNNCFAAWRSWEIKGELYSTISLQQYSSPILFTLSVGRVGYFIAGDGITYVIWIVHSANLTTESVCLWEWDNWKTDFDYRKLRYLKPFPSNFPDHIINPIFHWLILFF